MSWMGRTWRAMRHAGVCASLALLMSCGGGGDAQPAIGQLLADNVATFRGHGTWWNPAEPGTGFFFEAQGGVAIVSFFVYDEDGNPVWYSAAGGFSDAGAGRFQFQGPLQRFEDGPVIATADSVRPTTSTTVGTVTIAFEGSERAQVQLPGRSFQAVKFATRPAVAPAGAVVPETGVFWDPSRNGRGFTVEVDGSTVTVGLYGFTRSGRPTWRLAVGELKAGAVTVRPTIFFDGQTLDGPYRPPVGEPAPFETDDVTFQFETPCFGAISLNGSLPVQRFSFNGGGCRTASAVAPTARLVLAPDLPAATAFTATQLQALAGRALALADVILTNESMAHGFHEWQKAMAPGTGEGYCVAGGEAYWDNSDNDNSLSTSVGDSLQLGLYGCRMRLARPSGLLDTTLDGYFQTTLAQNSIDGFSSRVQFWWMWVETKANSYELDGEVLVRGLHDYWFTNQEFAGLGITTLADGLRTHVYAGTGRRHGLGTGAADVSFEQMMTALPLSTKQRVQARLRLEDANKLRFTAAGDLDHAPGQFTQGVLLIDFEPTKAEGYRLRLRVTGVDQLVLEHWGPGSQLLSSQTLTHRMLRTAAGLP